MPNVAEEAVCIARELARIRPESDICMILEPPSPYLVTSPGTIQVLGIGGSTVRLTYIDVQTRTEDSIPKLGINHEEIVSKQISTEAKQEGDFIAYAITQVKPYLKHSTPIAISMSFPVRNGRIVALGKQFNPMLIGTDVVEHANKLLQPDFKAVSVTHDGVASLITGIHSDTKCALALTLGTGVNITAIRSNQFLNTEIGYLGNPAILPCSHLPITRFDDEKHVQPFESMVGGLYLGKLVSRICGQEVSTEEALKEASQAAETAETAETAQELKELKELKELEELGSSKSEASVYVIDRAAALVAAAIVGMAASTSATYSEVHAVYTGGLISQPYFRQQVENWIKKLCKPNQTVQLEPELFGSEVGAGLQGLARIQASRQVGK